MASAETTTDQWQWTLNAATSKCTYTLLWYCYTLFLGEIHSIKAINMPGTKKNCLQTIIKLLYTTYSSALTCKLYLCHQFFPQHH